MVFKFLELTENLIVFFFFCKEGVINKKLTPKAAMPLDGKIKYVTKISVGCGR